MKSKIQYLLKTISKCLKIILVKNCTKIRMRWNEKKINDEHTYHSVYKSLVVSCQIQFNISFIIKLYSPQVSFMFLLQQGEIAQYGCIQTKKSALNTEGIDTLIQGDDQYFTIYHLISVKYNPIGCDRVYHAFETTREMYLL